MDYFYKERLEKVKALYNNRVGERNKIIDIIDQAKKALVSKKIVAEECTKVLELLKTVSNEAREKAKGQLEIIVTTALQYVSDQKYQFKIELTEVGGKPACEFYVVSNFNGIESKQKPQDACGGGFIDIIATALRYAYLNVYKDPIINNAIILDEPGKMISSQASIKFAEFIKELGKSFDRQTIMVTHNEDLQNIADNTHIVDQINGISRISKMSTIYNIDLGDIEL